MSILGLQPRDMAAMLVVNAIKNYFKEFTRKQISSGEIFFVLDNQHQLPP